MHSFGTQSILGSSQNRMIYGGLQVQNASNLQTTVFDTKGPNPAFVHSLVSRRRMRSSLLRARLLLLVQALPML